MSISDWSSDVCSSDLQRHDLSAEAQIRDMAEMLRAAVALTVDQHEGRRALHPIARHRDRQTARFSRRVDDDREGDAIFVAKGLEQNGSGSSREIVCPDVRI